MNGCLRIQPTRHVNQPTFTNQPRIFMVQIQPRLANPPSTKSPNPQSANLWWFCWRNAWEEKKQKTLVIYMTLKVVELIKLKLARSRWWQLKDFWNFLSENWGKMIQFDAHIFQMGWFQAWIFDVISPMTFWGCVLNAGASQELYWMVWWHWSGSQGVVFTPFGLFFLLWWSC